MMRKVAPKTGQVGNAPPQRSAHGCRIFVAAPMSGFLSADDYVIHRGIVNLTCDALDADGHTSYFAGRNIASAVQFASPSAAFKQDFDALKNCDLFVLYYPEPVRSSVLVEAGMAIGLKKPCLFVAKQQGDFVYLLRNVSEISDSLGVPSILIREFSGGATSSDELVSFIKAAIVSLEVGGPSRRITAVAI